MQQLTCTGSRDSMQDASAVSGFVGLSILGAQKTTETQGSDTLVPRNKIGGIPEIMVCRILMFMWSFGP